MHPTQLLLLVSERRSGSTHLIEAFARALPCAVDLGEALTAHATSGGYKRQEWSVRLSPQLEQRLRWAPLAWLRHVREVACTERPHVCDGARCLGLVKVMRHHDVTSAGLQDLLRATDTTTVLLERDAVETQCSLRWALHSFDWANSPRERRRAGRDATYRRFFRTCVARGVSPDYARGHARWYRQARVWTATRTQPAIEVSFADVTQRTRATVERVAEAIGMGVRASAFLPPSRLPQEPVVRPTLALVTIVAHSQARIGRWVRHHLRLGASEIFLYWQRRPAVAWVAPDARVRHHTVAEAVRAGGNRSWWLAWRTCKPCCRPPLLTRDVDGEPRMCQRHMFMPQQAHCARHALARSTSEWLLSLDLDEFLVEGAGEAARLGGFLSSLQARARPPGGVKVLQLQMVTRNASDPVDNAEYLRPRKRDDWGEHKALVRRAAVHPDPGAYGSIHEVTLKRGEQYLRVPPAVLALLHYRYDGWSAATRRARLADLGCARRGVSAASAHLALVCKAKRAELDHWNADYGALPRLVLDGVRLPRA